MNVLVSIRLFLCSSMKLLSTENTHVVLEKFNDTKWTISSRKSTDSQCNI